MALLNEKHITSANAIRAFHIPKTLSYVIHIIV